MDRTSAATPPVGFFNRPFGLPFGGHLRPRAAQPYGPIRFRRPRPYLPRRKSNTGAMECEKCGLDARTRRRECPAGSGPSRALRSLFEPLDIIADGGATMRSIRVARLPS